MLRLPILREAARAAKLRYVADRQPGIMRRRTAEGFVYRHPDGSEVTAEETLGRLRKLAIPPGYEVIWICWRCVLLAAIVALPIAGAAPVEAEQLGSDGAYVRDCLVAAGNAYGVPAALLVILLNVEGGRLGAISPNTNGTVDIGPMQVNDIWLPKLAQHWAASRQAAYLALRDNFCANVEAGAWILRMGLDEARGDLWEGVAFYHSHDPDHKRAYLASVLKQILRLRQQASRPRPAAPSVLPPPASTASQVLSSASAHDRLEGY
ncbi:MAG: hypothetical protein J2P47_11885 [Acetobacteraceae bacterium]|nr:hypothetical protein [Acetobacteraceae bacterium]